MSDSWFPVAHLYSVCQSLENTSTPRDTQAIKGIEHGSLQLDLGEPLFSTHCAKEATSHVPQVNSQTPAIYYPSMMTG